MGTYSDSPWDTNHSTHFKTPDTLKAMAEAAATAIGVPKYGHGIKGGWNIEVLGETEKATIRYLRDKIGVTHISHWIDEPKVQAMWDAWGFFLHDDGQSQISV